MQIYSNDFASTRQEEMKWERERIFHVSNVSNAQRDLSEARQRRVEVTNGVLWPEEPQVFLTWSDAGPVSEENDDAASVSRTLNAAPPVRSPHS